MKGQQLSTGGDMPVTYSFLQNAVWLNVSGHVLPAEFSEGINQAIADDRFAVRMILVFDLRDYTRIASAKDLQARAKFLGALNNKISSTLVILVSSDYRFGLARRFEPYAEQNGIEVEVFREEDQLIEWLKKHQKNLVLMSTPDEEVDRALFMEFCEVAKSNSNKKGRLAFLRILSEQICMHFDLPFYTPETTGNPERAEEFYKNDIVKIVKELWLEDFDVDEVLTSYLLTDDHPPKPV
jgi:hypothetical protein